VTYSQAPYFTFETQKIRGRCRGDGYAFSNWITTTTNCSAARHNEFYTESELNDYQFIEQW
jgi:hypothetical protein